MRLSAALAIVFTASAAQTHAAELQPATLTAWNAYLEQADSRAREHASGRLPFLWIDSSPDRLARLRRGEAIVAPVVGRGTTSVPHGLVHDWIGAIFIPETTINAVWPIVHDYNNYQRIYRPAVASSKELACAGGAQEFQMVWQRKVLFVSAAMEGHYHARDVMVDENRRYSVADAVEIREIERFGRKDQRLLPPDTGNGYMWRIRSISKFEQRDGGVYLELEALALTRDIPASVAWLVNPVVNHLSVNSLSTTLQQTRDAVLSSRGASKTLTSSRVSVCVPATPNVSGE